MNLRAGFRFFRSKPPTPPRLTICVLAHRFSRYLLVAVSFALAGKQPHSFLAGAPGTALFLLQDPIDDRTFRPR